MDILLLDNKQALKVGVLCGNVHTKFPEKIDDAL